ncbi:hypothetical protein MC7420_4804 [Coleofasciculus chthonoplastes PCC 7420]|uniref:Ketohydroxyglutarate aldolase n=1 Tax=Coleofasciculus chthonoplastes PCC 7420 TaxID=118168 RepID=B4VNK1_9CYAN|nr:hypothetical protein [Coleofasciculus chthonoplastes]EDX76548.1 hypothetical protein MC7420_4804 [Coleofasciculus chthonoplastes PCC 7420]
MANVDLLISVSSDYINRIPDIVEKLRSMGMINIQSMEAIGVITGLFDEEKLADIAAIEGVTQVERSQKLQISPPESPIQ